MRTVSSGMLPRSCGYIIVFLLLFAAVFLPFYHCSIAFIRQQSRVRKPPPPRKRKVGAELARSANSAHPFLFLGWGGLRGKDAHWAKQEHSQALATSEK